MSKRNALPDVEPAIARLRQIAAEAGDHLLLADGPVHPDARILDLCAEALHHLTAGSKAYESRSLGKKENFERPYTDEMPAKDQRLWAIYSDEMGRAKAVMWLIGKSPAQTGAGIYAKAMVVRASRSGAPLLGVRLAEDLLNNSRLRALLWSADLAAAPAEEA